MERTTSRTEKDEMRHTEYQQGTRCFIRRSKSVSRLYVSDSLASLRLPRDIPAPLHLLHRPLTDLRGCSRVSFRFLFYSSIRFFLTALFAITPPKTIPFSNQPPLSAQQRITKLIYKPNEYTRLVGLIEMQMGMPYSGLWRTSYFTPPCPPPILFRRVFQGEERRKLNWIRL